MKLLPELDSPAAYARIVSDEQVWRPALRVIAERHGLALASLRRAEGGTHVVYLGDAVVVKLYAPMWSDDARAERRMLEHVGGRLAIATPEIAAADELEGWPYLLFSRLPGRHLTGLWSELDPAEQRHLLAQLGELAADLHALPRPPEAAIEWAEFLSARYEQLAAKHRSDGVADEWIAEIERLVDDALVDELRTAELAALHMDLHHDHLMVRESGGRLTLSGLFDFGDAMFGAREHELMAPLAFMAVNTPGGARALLRGYGYAPAELDAALARRLTGHLLLQRYCRLSGVMARLRGAEPPRNLAALLDRLWDFSG